MKKLLIDKPIADVSTLVLSNAKRFNVMNIKIFEIKIITIGTSLLFIIRPLFQMY